MTASIANKRFIGTVCYLGGVPTIPEPFVHAWSQMIQWNNEYLVGTDEVIYYTRAQNSFHSHARNEMVKHMLGDWLLMFDCDHVFEPDIAARMVNLMYKCNISVLSGLYTFRNESYGPVAYQINPYYEEGKSDESLMFSRVGDWDPEAVLIEIGSAGAGCLLVRKKVYKRIYEELKTGPFTALPPHSEDHSFFRRLRTLGIKAFLAPQIECHHLTWKKLSSADYDNSELELMDIVGSKELLTLYNEG